MLGVAHQGWLLGECFAACVGGWLQVLDSDFLFFSPADYAEGA